MSRAWPFIRTLPRVSASTDPPVCRPARRYSRSSRELPGAAVVEQALRDLAGRARGERDQQPPGVPAPAGQVHGAGGLAGDRGPGRHRGAGEVLHVPGVLLVPGHVRRLAAGQRGADPAGAGELPGVAEARRPLNAVQVPLKTAARCQPGQRYPTRIGEDDADQLASFLEHAASAERTT